MHIVQFCLLVFTVYFNDGYELVGSSTIVCTSQGIWIVQSHSVCNSIAVTSGIVSIEYNNYADSTYNGVC